MNKILTIRKAIETAKILKAKGKKIVLAGGCFDILHLGHIRFLQAAKAQKDVLFVMLENDEKIKELKGAKRPINSQKDRAVILSSLAFVDYIVLLPKFNTNKDYDNLVNYLKPDIIATTKGDKYRSHKERQAKKLDAKVIDVIEELPDKSTTALVTFISEI
ncbi:adenylyltransferase/cytidyltransferase family protein [Patescibacteria group bacterium]|nr:adenylyltransferase/cytidyltransferase family protein [Patescibacteria group bacterium]MCL5010283.1 adenylyltransferase/cytidyltransferase family protein [Patescibacteria group bacterium]